MSIEEQLDLVKMQRAKLERQAERNPTDPDIQRTLARFKQDEAALEAVLSPAPPVVTVDETPEPVTEEPEPVTEETEPVTETPETVEELEPVRPGRRSAKKNLDE